MSYYHHQYLIALDGDFRSPEEAAESARDAIVDYLDLYFDRLYDSYDVEGAVWAKDIGSDKFMARIREALARRDQTVQSYLGEIKKAYPGGIPYEAFAAPRGYTMSGLYMYRLLGMFEMDMPIQESEFFNFVDHSNHLPKNTEADIQEHPERYALVSVTIHY